MRSLNNFVCKLAVPAKNPAKENFKLVIPSVNLIIKTKQLISTTLKAHMELLQLQNMRHQISRVQKKHLIIPENQTSINFDNGCTCDVLDLVIVCHVSDVDLAGGYQRNSFTFQTFGVNRIEMKRNGTSVPRKGYTPNFVNGQYLKAYSALFFRSSSATQAIKASVLPRLSGPTIIRYTPLKSPTV